MSEIEPQKHGGRLVAPRHIPQMIVPIAPNKVRSFVRDALKGTSLADPFVSAISGWAFFKPYVRFTPVDASHTRIEIDAVGKVRGTEILFYAQRRAEIDRFFVAMQDQLDRLERWRALPNGSAVIEDPSKEVAPPARRRSPRHRHILGETSKAAVGEPEDGESPSA